MEVIAPQMFLVIFVVIVFRAIAVILYDIIDSENN